MIRPLKPLNSFRLQHFYLPDNSHLPSGVGGVRRVVFVILLNWIFHFSHIQLLPYPEKKNCTSKILPFPV